MRHIHEAATITEAFRVAERWVGQNEHQAMAMVNREAKWNDQPATPKQLQVLRRKYGTQLPGNITKGHASYLIGSLMASRAATPEASSPQLR
jgi:hypothetical protein